MVPGNSGMTGGGMASGGAVTAGASAGALAPAAFLQINCAGDVIVRATQAGNGNYHAAHVDRLVRVAKGTHTVGIEPIAAKTYGDPPFQLGAASTAGVGLVFSVLSGPATVTGDGIMTITGAGEVTVRATGANDNYLAAHADETLTIGKAPLIIRAAPNARSYWDPDPVFQGTIEGLVNGDVITAIYSPSSAATVKAGLYSIVPSPVDPGGRLSHYVLTIVPADFTISNPVPSLTSLAPNTAVSRSAEGDGAVITLTGADFVRESTVFWNDQVLDVTSADRTTLQAVVPAQLLGSRTVGYIRVESDGPGGGTSDAREFFVTDAPTTVESAATATSSDGAPVTVTAGDNGQEPSTVVVQRRHRRDIRQQSRAGVLRRGYVLRCLRAGGQHVQ
jgi:hypothetical protein